MSSSGTSFLFFSAPKEPHSDPQPPHPRSIPITGGGFNQEKKRNIHFFKVLQLSLDGSVVLIQVLNINTVFIIIFLNFSRKSLTRGISESLK